MQNKYVLKQNSKLYKKVMNQEINNHTFAQEDKLRNMQSLNPKDYWKYINSLNKKQTNISPSAEDFFNYYNNMNDSDDDDESNQFEDINFTEPVEELNIPISAEEIQKSIRNLKNGKAYGGDEILNEYIKSTAQLFMPLYVSLFNKVFSGGVLPETWLDGYIKPIYKNKGSPEDPENYRPITILSCLGKLFTSVLNNRLSMFLEDNEVLYENQAGFRKGYATTDHIFSLHALRELLKLRKKKLFCVFIDFSQAFDSVWRVGLWQKMLRTGINGRFFKVIHNIYKHIKSCVFVNQSYSPFFMSNRGVRQGENLSPLLFSLFLNDLEEFLMTQRCNGIPLDVVTDEITCFTELFLLLYADDTVLLADNEVDLQNNLNAFKRYCDEWKLKINFSKTKVVIFGSRNDKKFRFFIGEVEIDIVDSYKYLGVVFSKSGSFLKAKNHIVQQANKAMFLLLTRIQNLNLPLDLQLKLFDHTVMPILTYGSEIWGFENTDSIEKVHNDFLRKITRSKRSTPMYMVYAELGRHPISLDINCRMISFWTKIITGKQSKLSSLLYQYMYSNGNYDFKWLHHIRSFLCNVGRNDIWLSQQNHQGNIKYLVKNTLIDQFTQRWHSQLQLSSKGKNYGIFKEQICLEKYLTALPRSQYLNIYRIRTTNHRLPIEVGRWHGIALNERKCTLCNKNDLGDEYHYLLRCPFFAAKRKQFIDANYSTRPNMLKFKELLNNQNVEIMKNLSLFSAAIFKQFK